MDKDKPKKKPKPVERTEAMDSSQFIRERKATRSNMKADKFEESHSDEIAEFLETWGDDGDESDLSQELATPSDAPEDVAPELADAFDKKISKPVNDEMRALTSETRMLTTGAEDLIRQATIVRAAIATGAGASGQVDQKLIDMQDRLVTELKKQVEYVERLNQMTIVRTVEREDQKKAKGRYMKAFVTSVVLLIATVLYFRFGLSEDQRNWIMEKSRLSQLLKQKDKTITNQKKTIVQTKEVIKEKEEEIEEKAEVIKEKEEEIEETKGELVTKERDLKETKENLANKEQELEAAMTGLQIKTYVSERVHDMKKFSEQNEALLELSQRLEKEAAENKKFLSEKHEEMRHAFNQMAAGKKIYNTIGKHHDENMMSVISDITEVEQQHLAIMKNAERIATKSKTSAQNFIRWMKKEQELFLDYDLESGGIKPLKKEFKKIVAAEKKQEQRHSKMKNIEKQLASHKKKEAAIYIAVLQHYQRQEFTHKTFLGIYQQKSDIEALRKKIDKLITKSEQKDIKQKTENHYRKAETHIKNVEKLYGHFLNTMLDKQLPTMLKQNKEIKEHINDREKRIGKVMDQVHEHGRGIGSVSKNLVNIYQSLREEIRRQIAAREKAKNETTKVETVKPVTETTKPVRPITKPKKPTADEIFQSVKTYFSMAPCEFVVKGSTFQKQGRKLVLKNYTIFKIYSQAYKANNKIFSAVFVQTMAPANQKGNRILKRGTVYWFYDKREDMLVRVTPNQQLENAIDVVDIAALSYEEYKAEGSLQKQNIKGNELYIMTLRSQAQTGISMIKCYYSAQKRVPVKMEYFDKNNKKRFDFYCRAFQSTPLGKRIRKYVVVDNKNSIVIEMEYLNVVKRDFPSYFFDKNYIKQIR